MKDLKITVIGSGEDFAARVADISSRLDDYDQAYRCVTGIGYTWFDLPCVPEDTVDAISWSVRTEPDNGITVYFKTYDVNFRG